MTITRLEQVSENPPDLAVARAAHRVKSPFRSREVASEQREIERGLAPE
jgi:hypothetical protein